MKIKKYTNFINESSNNNLCNDKCKELIKYIENNSSFELNNNKNEETLIFTTRKNGNFSSGQYSNIDYQEGINLIKTLKNMFTEFEYNIEIVDEWVDLNIKKINFYKGYEPDENCVGYVLSYVRSDGMGHSYETRDVFNTYSGRNKHRSELKKLVKRFIKDKTPDEVVVIADSLPIKKPYSYSEKFLIQKAHNQENNKKWETIPNADFYVSRREIW